MTEKKPPNYWEERELAKKEALKMAAQLTQKEQGYLVRTVHNAAVDEVRRDQIRQRRFERRFLSLDYPADDGLPYDYSNGHRDENRMIRDIDAPFWESVKNRRFWKVLYLLRGHPELQKTVRAIRTFRVKEKIISALQIKGEVYEKRLQRVREILKISS